MKKRLVIDVTPEEHRRIKEEAAARGTSVRKLVLQALIYYAQRFNK